MCALLEIATGLSDGFGWFAGGFVWEAAVGVAVILESGTGTLEVVGDVDRADWEDVLAGIVLWMYVAAATLTGKIACEEGDSKNMALQPATWPL